MSDLKGYKCPCCGGEIEFQAATQKMKCPYCTSEFDPEAMKDFDSVLDQKEADEFSWENEPKIEWAEGETDGLRIYICNSCGGEVIGDETLAASSCPYCKNPVVMMGQFKGDLKPDYIIPFKLDKEAAMNGFRKHLQGKRLLPRVFQEENSIEEIKAVYVPYWLFDTDVDADITYKTTNVHMWSDSRYNYTRTSHYSVFRKGSIKFGGVPVDGSSKLSNDLSESVEPFNMKDAVDFQTAYLSGFLADRYDVNEEESKVRANQRIKQSTIDEFTKTVTGYASVKAESANVRFSNGSEKYALLPVWVMSTAWQGKKYIFAMNGQTGKFVGNLPLDKKAYHKWLWGLTGAVSAAVLAVSYLVWFLF